MTFTAYVWCGSICVRRSPVVTGDVNAVLVVALGAMFDGECFGWGWKEIGVMALACGVVLPADQECR
ncbi:hypothetical protein FUT69_05375 [Xylella taiwanensis]|uniref:hypothetical protein n=1 Tax=Xylella taiwanensis TaxID=1444770 RepID=UPI00135F18E4|nr:hypothetical protein [Xylella taiwanensis]MCD8455702.1 hypothetical protein [Xylella taiwanensis]NBI36619.1 hypothetical protein [Xylella taiwanensis]UFN40490.1 hypothetical protein LPH57_07090 [Xylella taiwanensis]UFS48629.1 hypothetical protein LPH54_06160 [Xylella taiwanensis]UFS50920.1 hypothetical protein LPH56_06170 [Xylella taiwanensis]